MACKGCAPPGQHFCSCEQLSTWKMKWSSQGVMLTVKHSFHDLKQCQWVIFVVTTFLKRAQGKQHPTEECELLLLRHGQSSRLNVSGLAEVANFQHTDKDLAETHLHLLLPEGRLFLFLCKPSTVSKSQRESHNWLKPSSRNSSASPQPRPVCLTAPAD